MVAASGLSSPFINNPVFNYNRQTEYLINITRDNGCITVDTVLVKIYHGIPSLVSDLFVPKAWTPNNDGHNDKLFPITVNIRELKYFRVFNRWGNWYLKQILLVKDGMEYYKENQQ